MDEMELQALLDRQVGRGHVHNLVVGVQSGDRRIDLAAAAGTADPQTGAGMNVETPYSIASITKMYTTTAILMLHERGQLSLDATMASYLPGSLIAGCHVLDGRDRSGEIRVYQLVNQTSRLADYFLDRPRGGTSVFDDLKRGRDRKLDIEQIMAVVRGLPAKFEPGADGGRRAAYADTNYRLLGAIIEAVTGESLTRNFQEMLFTPLGLKHTFVYDAAEVAPDQKPATIYLKDRPVDLPGFFSSNKPDGGIVSTAAESLVLLRAFFDGGLFDKGFFDRMKRWNRIFFPMQYGYGMMRVNLPRAFSPLRPFPEYIGHSGSTGSFAYFCPDKSLYLVGTLNQIATRSLPIRLMMRFANALSEWAVLGAYLPNALLSPSVTAQTTDHHAIRDLLRAPAPASVDARRRAPAPHRRAGAGRAGRPARHRLLLACRAPLAVVEVPSH